MSDFPKGRSGAWNEVTCDCDSPKGRNDSSLSLTLRKTGEAEVTID
ncbi:hypothetical protein [Methanorbis furvi]